MIDITHNRRMEITATVKFRICTCVSYFTKYFLLLYEQVE
jgi:hypothetical protein